MANKPSSCPSCGASGSKLSIIAQGGKVVGWICSSCKSTTPATGD